MSMTGDQVAALVQALVQAAQSTAAAASAATAAPQAQAAHFILRDETRFIDKPERFQPKTHEEDQARWDD